jgi:hypothetical protein
MFKEPGESSPKRTAGSIDRAAASSRSTIRRERTIRDFETRRRFANRNESQNPDGAAADLLARSRTRTRTRTRVRARPADGTEQILEENRERGGRRWSTMIDSIRHGEPEVVETTRRRQDGRERLRDALQLQSLGQRNPSPVQIFGSPRSPRAPALRFEVDEPLAEEHTLLSRPYMPSPPYSFSDSAINRRPRGADGPFEIIPADPTPGFAPARGVHHDNEDHERVTNGSAPRDLSSLTASYPTMSVLDHISPRSESYLSRYGGLGDRRRSLSSSPSDAAQDTWETLLTTMEPDAHLPSADSSFTSATASQSTRQSRYSSQTRTTSFPSTATPTERHLSRPSSPPFPYFNSNDAREMDLEIQSSQYDCLSRESRASMRTMLDVILHSRRFRAGNPVAGAAEHRRRRDENLILSNHFNTLMTMDGIRAPSPATGAHPPHDMERPIPHQPTTDAMQPRVALDLLRTLGIQTQQLAEEIEDARSNRRQDTASAQELGFAQAAEDSSRLTIFGHQTQQQRRQQRNQDIADAENELDSMQRVIERMARREDIPDEWWAAAGLTRTIRENR